MYKFKVFLDTNVLLKGFVAFREGQLRNFDGIDDIDAETFKRIWFSGPIYMRDPSTYRYTFEKCVYEAYMAFRGIGGKKPDEGRGRWAETHLKNDDDPSPLGKLASQLHSGNIALTHYWIQHILEAQWGIHVFKEMLAVAQSPESQARIIENLTLIKRLLEENQKYEALCKEFYTFLQMCNVNVLPYMMVFANDRLFSEFSESGCSITPALLDSFARETTIPSEDFEIVYAAMRLGPDLFVTDDKRLVTSAQSLGPNQTLTSWRFCSSEEYEIKMAEKQEEYREYQEAMQNKKEEAA